MALTQLIYASQPFGFDAATLSNILLDARRCNRRDGITGALIARQDLYLQLLEGPKSKVTACYDRIRADDHHAEITPLVWREIKQRLFPPGPCATIRSIAGCGAWMRWSTALSSVPPKTRC